MAPDKREQIIVSCETPQGMSALNDRACDAACRCRSCAGPDVSDGTDAEGFVGGDMRMSMKQIFDDTFDEIFGPGRKK